MAKVLGFAVYRGYLAPDLTYILVGSCQVKLKSSFSGSICQKVPPEFHATNAENAAWILLHYQSRLTPLETRELIASL